MNDVLDILMDPDCDLWSKTDSDNDEMTLAINPPFEKACVDSDRDSDASDDLNEVLLIICQGGC